MKAYSTRRPFDRAVLERRRDVFFMAFLFGLGGPARVNQSDPSRPFCKANDEQPRLRRKADDDVARLVFRMVGIVENARQWVRERSQRFVKGHAVFLEIGLRFYGPGRRRLPGLPLRAH